MSKVTLDNIDSMIQQLKLLKRAVMFIDQDCKVDEDMKLICKIEENMHTYLNAIFLDIYLKVDFKKDIKIVDNKFEEDILK